MDPPVPKPRNTFGAASEPLKRPVPLPRSKVPPSTAERVTATDIIRSIGSASKQLGEDVAQKVQNSAKTANEKLEKSIIDGSKFARGKLEKTISTSRAMRDSVTKSVIEGTKTASMRLRRAKKSSESVSEDDAQRCVSMPVVDVSLFDNIQFHSPMMELKKFKNNDLPSLNLNSYNFDEESIFSSASDSNPDTVSNFSYDSKENDTNISSLALEENSTYDTPQSSRSNSIFTLPPDIPERRKKRESKTDFMRQNSLYENWLLPGEPQPATPQRVSDSTIFEFDPLNTTTSPKYEGISNEQLLESFLTGDTYGTIGVTDNNEDNFEEDHYGETDYFNPPTPPERSDSLFPEDTPATTETSKNTNSNWFINTEDSKPPEDTTKANNTSVMQKFSNIWKLDSRSKSAYKQIVPKVETVEKPPINNLVPYYSGVLTRMVSGSSGVEDLFHKTQTRYCVLSDMKLNCYIDPTNTVLKEFYTLDSIYSVQVVLPLSTSNNNSFCLELSLNGGPRGAPRKLVFSCGSASERRNWAQKLAEGLTRGFQPKYTAEFTRCGWCYLKEGVSGEWHGAWVMLIRRVLVYNTGEGVKTVDLRKTRCVVTRDAEEETKKLCPNDGSPNLLLDCPRATLYLRYAHERELKGWRYMVKLAAHNNGAYIHHQQLTKDDVPTVVDKCISFIYAHGSMTEGIYRRAGSSSVLAELLARFRRDAWSVQLGSTHSEHDAAGVLKRFFRDLPEPLIPRDVQPALREALLIEDPAARHAEYRRVMESLPLVVRNTVRKLFAHLHFLQTLCDVNKMTAENLASVWAPTIMPAALTSDVLPVAWSSKEVFVIRELITHFVSVWQPTEAELRREEAVRRVLRGVASHASPASPAGDLKAWLYVHDRSTHYQVTLTPSKTSADVCIELSEKAQMDSHRLMLEEVVCGEALRRVVHLDEVVLDVVLRWGYWDDDDRRDNYLLVRENKVLHEMEALRPATSLVCGELKFANETSKTFKSHMFEFQNGKLCYFKDKQGSHQLEEWNIRDILWYIGHEPKRNPQTRWTITFIPRNNKQKRSKERPWFGCTLAGAVTEDQLKWTSAMTFAEHSHILPTPRLVIT